MLKMMTSAVMMIVVVAAFVYKRDFDNVILMVGSKNHSLVMQDEPLFLLG